METVENSGGKMTLERASCQPYSARVEVAPSNGTHRRKKVSARSSSQRRRDAGPISVRFRLEWNQTAAAGAPIPCGVRRLWPPTATFSISSRNAAAVVSQENCRLQLKAPSDNRVCRSVSRATLPLARWPFIRPVSRVSCREAGALLFRAFATRRGKAQ
jgi:hypothetical protein